MITSTNRYSVIRDEQGRWIFGVCEATSDLPTSGVPANSIMWCKGDATLYQFMSGSWTAAQFTVGVLAAATFAASTLVSGPTGTFNAVNTTVNGVELTDKIVRNAKRKFTVAEINAGTSWLSAVAGQKYRVIHCEMIAIGGALGTATSVDVLGTQSAGSVKLFAGQQASLTENKVCTNAVPAEIAELAAGLTHTACDANTAITVGKTGGAADTATHVIISLDYVMEAA